MIPAGLLAEKINVALRETGYSTYYLESWKSPLPTGSEAIEVSVGVPNIFPPVADGDVLVQVSDDIIKVTTDIMRVPQDRSLDMVTLCNIINAKTVCTRFYVQPDEMVIVADHDYMNLGESVIDEVVAYLPMFKHDVNEAHRFFKYAPKH